MKNSTTELQLERSARLIDAINKALRLTEELGAMSTIDDTALLIPVKQALGNAHAQATLYRTKVTREPDVPNIPT